MFIAKLIILIIFFIVVNLKSTTEYAADMLQVCCGYTVCNYCGTTIDDLAVKSISCLLSLRALLDHKCPLTQGWQGAI